MGENAIQVLVQGGLASVALCSLYINYKIVSNHLTHSDDVMRELTVAIGELKELIKAHMNKEN